MSTIQIHKPPFTNCNEIVRDGEEWTQAAERAVRKMTGIKGASIATINWLSQKSAQCMFVMTQRRVGRVLGTYIVRLDVDA